MLYPKIETIFERDEKTFKVLWDAFKLKDPIFSIPKTWDFTEKIDGTNISVEHEPLQASLKIGGRTEKTEVPQSIKDYIHGIVTVEKLNEIFEEKRVVIFGEGYGGKIQAGEEDKNRGGKYSKTEKFIVFDILVEGKYWLSRPNVESICTALELEAVPFVGNFTIPEAVEMARKGFYSSFGEGIKAEGLIGKTSIPLFDAKHRRLICKIKSCDF
jgi:hypothetical protein